MLAPVIYFSHKFCRIENQSAATIAFRLGSVRYFGFSRLIICRAQGQSYVTVAFCLGQSLVLRIIFSLKPSNLLEFDLGF